MRHIFFTSNKEKQIFIICICTFILSSVFSFLMAIQLFNYLYKLSGTAEETRSPLIVQTLPVDNIPTDAILLPPHKSSDQSLATVLQDITEQNLNPYAELNITDSEKELLACMAYSEARGEPFEGQVAVIQVALNRYMHEAFDGSISDILLAPNQFSVGKTYEEGQMEAVEAALAGEPALDLNTDVVFFSTGKLTYGSYYKTIGGHIFRTYF